MTKADLPVLFLEMRKLCSIFNRTFDETLGESYAETLATFPIETIVANAQAARLGDHFPRPNELMAELGVGSPEVEAARAWELARPHFAHHTEPADPIARDVVRLLGGSAVIGGKDSAVVDRWTRNDFLRLYVDLARDGKRQEIVRRALENSAARGVGSGGPTSSADGALRSELQASWLNPQRKGTPAP